MLTAGLDIPADDLLHDVLHFDAVGSDVLHGSRSGLAGDEREVFGSIECVLGAIGTDIVPDGARLDL